jgi:Domain of unknown function DUF29
MGSLYDDDILLWSERQAELLRRLARGERVNDALDFENLIDEVESVGRSELQAVESLLDVALRHLLLAHGAPRSEPIGHWMGEAPAALRQARKRFAPSMAPRLNVQETWEGAVEVAARKLAADGGPARPLPGACPSALAELLDRRADVDALLARLGAAA